ncbi:hypothetical protein HMPREF9136_1272 [Prevotella dentalis DSM 3688]|uniref:Uncharacterized protein n=1 Tax=Prevotella dentalis (strain ATCC 49559 / DSM 3688 / JCM 13448 / NCTC 12043 / ES 2772) TaxID=908937 RepID=F9D344_PREDD|nr:hypothetical protein HMPREF9136_1272 [Prevotella dentalis DSM 3688]
MFCMCFPREMFTFRCLGQISRGKSSLPVVLDKFPEGNAHFPLSWTNFPWEMFTSRCLGQISRGKSSLPVFYGLTKTTDNNSQQRQCRGAALFSVVVRCLF